MIQAALLRYINNFRGFSREIWILAIVTFVNRAGTMVLPFLSKYMYEDLKFSYEQVGWVMVWFGLGSAIGSWLGGKLADKIGFYKVMVGSLLTSGCLFFAIQYAQSFHSLCIAMFGIMVIADMFRPAMFVSIGTYAKPENRVRAFTLVRLAVNLGFAAGPAMGGLIITKIGYQGLFWADGTTCIISILAFTILVKERKKILSESNHAIAPASFPIWKDKPFLIFLFVSFLVSMVFFQLLTTIPLYHRERYGLNELQTGLLLTLNGLLVFFLEMPVVGYCERKNIDKLRPIFVGSVCMALSFAALMFESWSGVLVINIVFLSLGEIFAFPFSNGFAQNRAPKHKMGVYMGLFTMMFSLAHMFSSKIGMAFISGFGYFVNWCVMGGFSLLSCLLTLYVIKLVRDEN
ncbi:MDR family MFS transporter [Flavobacterium selenitireducens]|uniref:MDR family MFS transporter n=1 Tax=Flavobacterium selenitireducens TaxID=2722704 RepID=UPI00168BB0A8|nr:MFS transporter [Flavobacterium selenitireducens]MBD3581118.1 MFS transporter [Flavobacterium selenitireducens]